MFYGKGTVDQMFRLSADIERTLSFPRAAKVG
jgi:hypothetical protein